MPAPEIYARMNIDQQPVACGQQVQDCSEIDLRAITAGLARASSLKLTIEGRLVGQETVK